MTTLLDLDALKAKALAATPGPWIRSGIFYICTTERNAVAKIIAPLTDTNAADGDHIAAACPATMLELLARLQVAETNAAQSARDAEVLGRAIDRAGAAGGVRAPGMTFSVSNMVALAGKMGAELHACWMAAASRGYMPEHVSDPTKGRYNCAGDYVMPKPAYDPSLQVPAEIIEAANTVSTWAAKQDRGSWRIGDVCSADFGDNQKELARLRSNVAILSAQSEALHLVGHAIGVPAGEDVTTILPAVKALLAAAKHEHSCHRDGDITFTMSMRVGDQMFRAGRDLNGLLLGCSIDELPVIAVTAQGLYRQLKSEVADLTRLMACAPNLTPERARAIVSARDKHPADGSTKGGAQ